MCSSDLDPTKAGPRLRAKRPLAFADWPYRDDERRPLIQPQLESLAPGKIRVTLRNLGDLAVRGSVRVAGAPLRFNLKPGQTQRSTVAVAPAVRVVELDSSTPGVIPVALVLPGLLPDYRTPIILKSAARELGEIRLGTRPGLLTVRARVRDANIVTNPTTPWADSCIEVFGCAGATKRGSYPWGADVIRQVFLLPDSPATIITPTGIQPAPDVTVRTTRDAGGYELEAEIPLTMLGATAADPRVMVNFTVNAVIDPGAMRRRAIAFGESIPNSDTTYYAAVEPQ